MIYIKDHQGYIWKAHEKEVGWMVIDGVSGRLRSEEGDVVVKGRDTPFEPYCSKPSLIGPAASYDNQKGFVVKKDCQGMVLDDFLTSYFSFSGSRYFRKIPEDILSYKQTTDSVGNKFLTPTGRRNSSIRLPGNPAFYEESPIP